MNEREKAIAVFDSGIGGLTVAGEIARRMPEENIIYLGDTARLPYGSKSKETVIKYARKCVDFLISYDIKVIVIACNTVSSVALEDLRSRYDVPIIGVVEPGARAAVNISKNFRIGILGQEQTIKSKSYNHAIKKLVPHARIFSLSSPLLVPLAEEGWVDNDVAELVVCKYIEPMLKNSIDTLILGCTHYPLFKNTIARVIQGQFGKNIALVDSAVTLSEELKILLEEKQIKNINKNEGQRIFFVTDLPERFYKRTSLFFGSPFHNLEQVDI